MDITQFADQLKVLGADLERWPRDQAQAALALLTDSPAAQDLFASATADDLLVFGDDTDLRAQIDAIVERVER